MSTPCVEQRRHEQYDRIYLSPHMDDVAYSCSGRILQERAQGLRVLVVTIFGSGQPADTEQSGKRFSNYAERREEERAAMAALDSDYIWLNEPELLFRRKAFATLVRYFIPCLPAPEPEVQGRLIATVSALCQSLLADDGELVCPLGVGFHPDHRLVFEVGRALHAALPFPVRFYEDLPYGMADDLTRLRHRFLGDELVQVSPYRAAAETQKRLFKSLGIRRWPILALVFGYLSVLIAMQRALRWYDRFKGQPLPLPEVRAIEDVVDEKAAIMRLYASQTPLFFPDGEALRENLRRHGRFEERTWTFPSSQMDHHRHSLPALARKPKVTT